jgi:hypothetical protein
MFAAPSTASQAPASETGNLQRSMTPGMCVVMNEM